jgi:hypothetical protein
MQSPDALISRIVNRLWKHIRDAPWNGRHDNDNLENPSIVLLPIGTNIIPASQNELQPCLILNKRSQRVKQPGDLCCPGGGLIAGLDSIIAKLLLLPNSPLTSWPRWNCLKKKDSDSASKLALYLAAGLREAFEEMRLNPFRTKLLGVLAPQKLRMFNKTIFPVVVWVPNQNRFKPNWEVEKIVILPLKKLLDPVHYARYRLVYPDFLKSRFKRSKEDFPCFIHHRHHQQQEMLWGATYRIVKIFLNTVLDFNPPDHSKLPLYIGQMERGYMTGNDD